MSISSPPLLPVPFPDERWMHAGAGHLALPINPITAATTTYKAFTPDESLRIDAAWDGLREEERLRAVADWGRCDGEGAVKRKPVEEPPVEGDPSMIRSGEEQKEDPEVRYKDHMARVQGQEDLELIQGVPVAQDSMFEVDLPTLSLHPVFWAHTGSRVAVIKGSWFIGDETRPCAWELAQELEKAYLSIQPWQPSYKHELTVAVAQGGAAEAKLKHSLPAQFGTGLSIVFEDGDKGRLETAGTMSFISKTFWSSLRSKPSGTWVYRGFAAAQSGKNAPSRDHSRRSSSSSARPKPVVEAARDLETLALEEENAPVDHGEEGMCTDLVLVVHGIGQQLATQYEAYNFVYAGNALRANIRTQTARPSLASIVRDRRIAILPVQWRASLKLEDETSEDREHGMDNRFTVADITNPGLQAVREVSNSVLLDIPLFMSRHRQKMIEAVCMQANRLYRLWIARHPDFAQHGRVHMIGHSLGSCLLGQILSSQPTRMPPVSQLPMQVVRGTRDRLLFNVGNLFLCGSPLGIFLHLDQAQIMPRKGRERTMHSPQDEALDRAGRFGCMAIDSLYNIFYFTDPVAYQLNAAIDRELAKTRKPLAITPVNGTIASSLSHYLPASLRQQLEGKPHRPGAIRLPSGLEMLGPNGREQLEGSRAERRGSALNPHGSVDFFLPSGPSEYLDMVTAHANYWSDPSFAAFIVTEVFSERLDRLRTGLGLAN